MWQQILAITWAQFRTSRNHLPRTSFGTALGWFLLSLWYGLYAGLALFLAFRIPEMPLSDLARWLPTGLLGVFLFWQIIPLLTLSSGWSLQLNKLQIYPINDGTLFTIETILRVTSAPEMIIVLAGGLIGLLRHPHVPSLAPWLLLLFVPLNLFTQLGVRDLILHSFERNRFRELFAVVAISLGVLPQLLLRTSLGRSLRPYFFAVAGNGAAPWHEIASLSLGRYRILDIVLLLAWCAISFLFARWTFGKSLVADDSFQASSQPADQAAGRRRFSLSSWPTHVFSDPLAALIQKELRSLLRMPKFRVVFGMACVLGMAVFVPMTLNGNDPEYGFMRNNLLPFVNLYGLLLLSDTLLLNAFGLDRGAAQMYFLAPVSLYSVLMAKNIAAVTFVALQSAVVLLVAAIARAPLTKMAVGSALLASAVVTVFLLITGNTTSLAAARPIDPKQTFKKQAGAKMQLWLLGCSIGMFVLVGFAYLARYAFQSDWVLLAVLVFELIVGLIIYRLGLESAVKRGERDRETIVQLLSKSPSPVSLD
ncbi:MAG TPA: hypothetical protein VHZ55_19120 [Bryobacteraceae bacterium]|nr:hypothetical protein [Bryobacteraceae bacterium]